MTESTPSEPAAMSEPGAGDEPGAVEQPAADSAEGTGKGPRIRPKVLVWTGIGVVAVVVAAAVVFLVGWLNETEVGDCVNDTQVVSCTDPHEARIVQIVVNANDCLVPATYVMKEADGRYLCLVEEAS